MNNGALTRHPEYFAGLDLGLLKNHSALVIIERRDVVFNERDPVTMAFKTAVQITMRHIERMPLLTPYPNVVEHVRRVLSVDGLARRTILCPDATGLGGPVVELLKAASLPCELCPVTITSGLNESRDSLSHHVPKRDLLMGLQIAFQKKWLKISRRATHREAFVKELLDMRLRTSEATGYDHFLSGKQDDLVMAAALAWWRLRRSWPKL